MSFIVMDNELKKLEIDATLDTPKVSFDAFSQELPEIIKKVNTNYGKNISTDQVKLIAVSAGWGQFGMIGTNPIEITQNILLLELELRKSDLIQ